VLWPANCMFSTCDSDVKMPQSQGYAIFT
jgi:hypothetical protein